MKLTPEQEYIQREKTGGTPRFDKFGFVIQGPADKENLAARIERVITAHLEAFRSDPRRNGGRFR